MITAALRKALLQAPLSDTMIAYASHCKAPQSVSKTVAETNITHGVDCVFELLLTRLLLDVTAELRDLLPACLLAQQCVCWTLCSVCVFAAAGAILAECRLFTVPPKLAAGAFPAR